MAYETNDIKVGGIIEQLCNEGFDGITGAVITIMPPTFQTLSL